MQRLPVAMVYTKKIGAVHLNLIASTTNVIYYNPSTDPYDPASTGAGGSWNGQLQSTLTSVIGEANYDIGHLFGASGGGGNAGCIGCICTNGSKEVDSLLLPMAFRRGIILILIM